MKLIKITTLPALLSLLFACDSGPKVIESEPVASAPTGSATDAALGHNHTGAAPAAAMPGMADDHKMVAEEVLHTEKYTYVRGNENGQNIWIAIPKTNVEVGKTYFYKGGLEKKNFQSREFNRVFETLYLVSGLSTQPVGAAPAGGSAVDAALGGGQNPAANTAPPTEAISAKGSVKIADLMGNLKKYEGKTIRVTGKVMKINPMIMGRNWVHIQDGTANNFDLTLTTMEQMQIGSVVTLEGVVALNKDFGAGYRYNVIVEGAASVK